MTAAFFQFQGGWAVKQNKGSDGGHSVAADYHTVTRKTKDTEIGLFSFILFLTSQSENFGK